jgi:hypothetical protein
MTTEYDRIERLIETSVIALVAEFLGEVTGLRPPVERELFPPHMRPALDRLCDGLMQIVKETGDCRPRDG